jgi:hypothetical protein
MELMNSERYYNRERALQYEVAQEYLNQIITHIPRDDEFLDKARVFVEVKKHLSPLEDNREVIKAVKSEAIEMGIYDGRHFAK